MRSHKPLDADEMHVPIKVSFDARVFDYIIFEARKYPNAEEGGKYIGKMREIGGGGGVSVLVTDFLPGGPQAKRTSVEFMPDGEYQESMFRAIERVEPDVEHLGSWHTHHCNGLDRFSTGDIDGYFRTVNKRAYRPRVFVASLVRSIPSGPSAEGWISHFVFVRGDDKFYDVTRRVEVVDSRQGYGKWTGHESHEAVETQIGSWFESEVGRQTLAADRRLLGSAFSRVLSTRKAGQIRTRCDREGGRMTVIYPANLGDRQLVIDVSTPAGAELTVKCDVEFREAAFVAAVAALDHR
jgi:hypothetical protein